MKKSFVLIAAIAVGFASCKKSSDEATPVADPVTPVATGITAVPSTFTKKAIIEEFTGAWCGYCVDGALIVEEAIEANPTKVIGVSIHEGDGMETSLYNVLDGLFSNTGFPAGMVNRVPYGGKTCISRSSWKTAVNVELAKEAKCGLAIKTSYNAAGDSVIVEAHAGFKTALTGNYKMVSYLVEDSVTGTGSQYNQSNYYSSAGSAAGGASHPYYSLPAVIIGYNHMQVVRATLPSDLGEAVEASALVAGGSFVKTNKVKVGSTMKKANLSVVSFIYKVGTSSSTYEIMNVQKVKVGSLKNWD